MSFLEQLTSGNEEIQVSLGDKFETLEVFPQGVNIKEKEFGIHCHVGKSVRMVPLQKESEEQLLQDIEKIARSDFDAYYKTIEENAQKPFEPREGWSPVVTAKVIEVDGQKVLYTIYRIAYQPLHEIIIGSLLIPTANFTYEITYTVRPLRTGLRESLLTQHFMQENPDINPEKDLQFLYGQLDDEKYDELIKVDPLSVVRKELNWFLLADGGNLKINTPNTHERREITFPELNCSVTPPVGYTYAPGFKLMMPAVRTFCRSAITAKVLDYNLGSLNLYRVPPGEIFFVGTPEVFTTYAQKVLEAWKNEGVEDIEIQSRLLSHEGSRIEIETFSKLRINSNISYNLAVWIAPHEKEVYRLDCAFTHLSEKEEKANELTEFVNSLRFLASTKQTEQPKEVKKRKWWQLKR